MAIQTSAQDIENNVQIGKTIAILNFSSQSEQFSAYTLEELSYQLVKGGKFVIVERKELDIIRQEEKFQMSGEVSDESAQAIGKKLGAQLVVSGSLIEMGNTYRFRIKVINVETAAIEVSYAIDLDAKDTKIMFLLGIMKPTLVATQQENKIYKIGDKGPAGGIVFFDKYDFSDGWRYFEVATLETVIYDLRWGPYGTDLDTETILGSGKRNTQLLVEWLRQMGEFAKAAQYCNSLEYGGYTDWFLPSIDELELIYKNLAQKGIGGFGEFGDYWSSSQGDKNVVWNYSFLMGRRYTRMKDGTNCVLAIRSF
jgi:TolB-like protein